MALLYGVKPDLQHKTRCVIVGNRQQRGGPDDFDVYSPVVAHTTFRWMLAKMSKNKHRGGQLSTFRMRL